MKKIEYQAPAMEVVEIEVQGALLETSTGEVIGGGATEAPDDEEAG